MNLVFEVDQPGEKALQVHNAQRPKECLAEPGITVKMALQTLVQTARSLDQNDTRTVPDKLSQIWEALSSSQIGPFHAPDEVILRWLLKNMQGTSSDSELCRRFPLTWDIMACIFQRIPMFSLAKVLADRKFVQVVTQTSKDISKPQKIPAPKDESSNTVMADAPEGSDSPNKRKRKRSHLVKFDLDCLRVREGCLKSAESLFAALQPLLKRVESVEQASPEQKMGAEHIRSLFFLPATETLEYLVPLLRCCASALGGHEAGQLEKQETWVATINSIWDLHLQSPADPAQVAIGMAPVALVILAKLRGIPKAWDISTSTGVRDAWAKALEQFLMNTTILPARTALISRKDCQILANIAAGGPSGPSGTISAMLFHLALQACLERTQASARKINEEWVQGAFDVVEEPLCSLDLAERNTVMGFILGLAAKSEQSPSLESLRSVCTRYALQDDNTDWKLVSEIAQCDADAFLVSSKGVDLLDTVLQRVQNAANEVQDPIAAFLVALVNGFAGSRDLSGFIKRWYSNLSQHMSEGLKMTSDNRIWLHGKLRSAVARLLQPSLTVQQLLSLLDWIESQEASSTNTVRVVLFDTIACGIESEDFVDAVGTRLFDTTFEAAKGIKIRELQAMRWRIARKTLSWIDTSDARRVWKDIKKSLKKALANSDIAEFETFEAFRCALVAFDALKYVEKDEADAKKVVSDFLARLGGELTASTSQGKDRRVVSTHEELEPFSYQGDASLSPGVYLLAAVHGSPSLLSSITRGEKESSGLLGSFFSIIEQHNASQAYDEQFTSRMLELLLTKLEVEHNQGVIERAVNIFVAAMDAGKNQEGLKSRRVASSVDLLLKLPAHMILRGSRELIMNSLLTLVDSSAKGSENEATPSDWRSTLSLMVRVMGDPTFYEGMKFKDLVSLGESLEKSLLKSPLLDSLKILALFKELVKLTIRQMLTTVNDREAEYFRGLAKVTSKWSKKSSSSPLSRSTILNGIYSAVLEVPASRNVIQEHIGVEKIKEQLATSVSDALHRFKKSLKKVDLVCEEDAQLLPVFIALEHSQPRNDLIQQSRVSDDVTDLEAASRRLCAEGLKIGWALRTFLDSYFPQQLGQTEATDPSPLFESNAAIEGTDLSLFYAPVDLLRQSVTAVTSGMDGKLKLEYLQRSMSATKDRGHGIGELVAASQVLEQVSGETNETFDLALAQSILTQHLQHTHSPAESSILTEMICKILNKGSSSTTQWNIDYLLNTVCAVSDQRVKGKEAPCLSPATHSGLCSLVETIIKRHRLRLEGHFHLLVATLQSLLRSLIIGCNTTSRVQDDVTDGVPGSQTWRQCARQVSRLLELVCEPTVASVKRSQKPKLDSATDAAKRSAGQYMYLVLMLYIKLQLEQNVPHQLREALEPGVFSILTITTESTRKVMNDAMDSSGRAIFRETYKKWQRFGKWKGI